MALEESETAKLHFQSCTFSLQCWHLELSFLLCKINGSGLQEHRDEMYDSQCYLKKNQYWKNLCFPLWRQTNSHSANTKIYANSRQILGEGGMLCLITTRQNKKMYMQVWCAWPLCSFQKFFHDCPLAGYYWLFLQPSFMKKKQTKTNPFARSSDENSHCLEWEDEMRLNTPLAV